MPDLPPDAEPDAPAALSAGLSSSLVVLKKRADFLAAARGLRSHQPGFVLQARRRGNGPPRVGFTCSKKVGNAVARNRAKRRLREIARLVLAVEGRPGWDYVLVGRADKTAYRRFADLQDDLRAALADLHGRRA